MPRKPSGKGRSTKKTGNNRVWLITAIVLAGVLALVIWRKYGPPSQIPKEVANYKLMGVDVSKHSGKIKWGNLKSANVGFAYIKATEGVDYVDPLYAQNYKAAKENGVTVGVYHFFRFAKSGRKQAKHFIKNAKMQKGDLIPVIDVEVWGNTLSTRSDSEVIIEIGRFLNELELAVGARPMIYTNKDAFNRFIKGHYENYPLWFCSLSEIPTADAPRWSFWQYTHKGEIDGAPHPVDFNVFRYTRQELKSMYMLR